MKIGILTFHRACNYGAVLQCFALQEVLKRLGHDVHVIDYAQKTIDRDYYVIYWRQLLSHLYHLHIRSVVRCIMNVPSALRKKLLFKRFVNKYLNTTKKYSSEYIPSDFDAYIIGSDQLWNTNLTAGLDSVYTGLFKRKLGSKLYTYAVSTNVEVVDNIPSEKWKKILNGFNAVSVREPEVAKLLSKKTSINVCVDSDPTLITDSGIWEPLINDKYKNRRYVLLYEIWARTKSQGKSLYSHAKQLAEKLNIELIDLSDYKAQVDDFVSAFKYAEVVITSSFHGTAFALIFQRPFYVYKMNDSMDGRYVDLLSYLKAENLVKDLDFYPSGSPQIDFQSISQLLNKRKDESFLYLSNI